jgi:hypothetical protein
VDRAVEQRFAAGGAGGNAAYCARTGDARDGLYSGCFRRHRPNEARTPYESIIEAK